MSPSATEPIVRDTELPSRIPESVVTPARAKHYALFSLRDKTIIITGGGRGLGITLAAAVLEAGGSVVCIDILENPSTSEWSALKKTALANGTRISYQRCDITDESSLSNTFDDIAADATQGRAPLYGAIACAGIQQKIPAIEYPASDFRRILEVNVVGTFLTAKHTARILKKSNIRGSIVLIASMSGQVANRGLTCTAYNTSKSAVQQMCRSVAQEWGQFGIRVNTLSPGYIRTQMTDDLLRAEPEVEKTWMAGALLGRLGAPEDFTAPAIFLLGPGSSFMTGTDL